MGLTGLIVPSALERWTNAASFTRPLFSNRSYSSKINSPASVNGTTFRVAPVRSHSICQGTMLEWCSMPVMTISSPAFTTLPPKLLATRLMLSVVLRVKTISWTLAAFRKARTFSRAPS